MMRKLTITLAPLAFALAALASAQSLPNPGFMAADTPRMDSGKPAPDHGNNADLLFLRTAAMSGIAEVKLGQLAQRKGSGESVKAFGQRMETDHGKMNRQIEQAGRKLGYELPKDGLDAKHQAMLDELSALSGRDFDLAYLQMQVGMHQDAVTLLSHEVGSGQSAETTALAAEALPTVSAHLETAKGLLEQLKTSR